jgi:hypothetical protein
VPLSVLESMGVKDALEHVNVPSYVIDTAGVIRWVNPAGKRIVGDVLGRQFTSVVAPERPSAPASSSLARSSAERPLPIPPWRWSTATATGSASR